MTAAFGDETASSMMTSVVVSQVGVRSIEFECVCGMNFNLGAVSLFVPLSVLGRLFLCRSLFAIRCHTTAVRTDPWYVYVVTLSIPERTR